jgi:hypothetical protein
MWKIVNGFAALLLAEQLAVLPPLEPAQVQLHGPLPLTTDAIPIEHRFALGATATV